MDRIINTLLNSSDPSVRFKVVTKVLGQDKESAASKQLQQEIKVSPRVKLLLAQRDADGRIPFHPYAKWYGAHWVLADLAELGYPASDDSLIPLREQVYSWLFGQSHQQRITTIAGRTRRCASQEGNALYYLLALGLADDRTDRLAENLLKWQWPDGGWNCDKRPGATHSSFMESLIPLRGLSLYGQLSGDSRVNQAVERAAEIFLKRNLFKGQRDGQVISPDFVKLHYPCYWHYDILFGLKVMAEAGFSGDTRCRDALDLLASKRLPDGGFPAEAKYYRVTSTMMSGRSPVDWGGTSQKRMNEFITADALAVIGNW